MHVVDKRWISETCKTGKKGKLAQSKNGKQNDQAFLRGRNLYGQETSEETLKLN